MLARTTVWKCCFESSSTWMYGATADLGLYCRRKTFNKKAALVQHLRSANHSGQKFTCPSCLDQFDTLYALASHVESPSRKCTINREFDEDDMYRIFLDQLTLGMIECGGLFDDYTQKFKFQDEFKDLYDPQKSSGPTFGHMQMHGFSRVGHSGPPDRPGLTEATLVKHQEQLGRDSGYGDTGREMALTADALSRLQVGDKRGSPWGRSSPMIRQQNQQDQLEKQAQQQRQPGARAQPQAPQQQNVSYVGQQLGALGWKTWDGRPTPRKEDQGRLANSKPTKSGW